jgi:cell division protein FtsB
MLKNATWLFALTVVLFLSFLPSYRKMQDLKAKNVEYARRIEALQKRNLYLENEKRLLETDPVYLEKVARQKMGLIRDGEKVYRLVPAKRTTK